MVAFDAITKLMIVSRLALHEARPIIDGLFQLVYVQNPGAAFGIGANAESQFVPLLLNSGAIIVFVVVLAYSLRAGVQEKVLQTGLHLIVGGAIGNLVDRFRLGSVVDFLDFYLRIGGKEFHWPAFNVADVAICTGIVLLFVDMKNPRPATATLER